MMHIVSMFTSLACWGSFFVELLLFFVPPGPGSASRAWDLKSVVVNLRQEAAFQSDVSHTAKGRSTEWTNLNARPNKISTEDEPLL